MIFMMEEVVRGFKMEKGCFKGALDNFSLIPQFFSKKLRFLYH